MSNVKIKINIELVECDDNIESHDPKKEANGDFSMIVTENDSASIDKCESAMMRTVYPAVRVALSDHFAAVSKKKLLKLPNQE
ncbi:MAG: hypothetical protein GY755_22355 [Chloroflexi bacterium]|nr:hypothetical protein [Chloroflexota bacterium]